MIIFFSFVKNTHIFRILRIQSVQEQHWKAYQDRIKLFQVKYSIKGILEILGDDFHIQVSQPDCFVVCSSDMLPRMTLGRRTEGWLLPYHHNNRFRYQDLHELAMGV